MMLDEYEKDHKTGMDIEAISKEVRTYTSGYPYLVSRLCKTIDEKLEKNYSFPSSEYHYRQFWHLHQIPSKL